MWLLVLNDSLETDHDGGNETKEAVRGAKVWLAHACTWIAVVATCLTKHTIKQTLMDDFAAAIGTGHCRYGTMHGVLC